MSASRAKGYSRGMNYGNGKKGWTIENSKLGGIPQRLLNLYVISDGVFKRTKTLIRATIFRHVLIVSFLWLTSLFFC